MAKKKSRESSLPLVIALVFFVLATVGLGVFSYVLYSDQADKEKAVAEEKKKQADANKLAKIEMNKALVYKLVLGIDDPEDRTTLIAESKPGDDYVAELKKINERITKRLSDIQQADATLPKLEAKDVLGWAPDAENKLPAGGPTLVLLDSLARAKGLQEVAKKSSDDKVAAYDAAAAALAAKAQAYDAAIAELKTTSDKIKQDITDTLTKLQQESAARGSKYEGDVKDLRGKIDVHQGDLARINTKLRTAESKVDELTQSIAGREEAKKKGEQFFDEPLGRITRRLPDGTVEIDIGSNDKAKPGLTFTVLPRDFPVQGYQSRVKVFRMADDRNVFREVSRFVEKANIEIVEVLGPHFSKARVVSESNWINDAILTGDLLYNVAWRRGYVDHVALFGVFDINGDGIDDIKTVVRDFEKMGIPVDAYYDLKEKKWVGQLTGKTRFAIKGSVPNPSGNDPFYGEKAALNSALANAAIDAKGKGVTEVSFRDIFPRMGYRVKLDVSDDKINQAVSQYLQGVTAPTMPPQN